MMQSAAISFSSIARGLFSLESVYVMTGLLLWIFAALTFVDAGHKRRIGTGLFWLILGVIFVAGGIMPHWMTGILVLVMVVIDGMGRVTRGSYKESTKQQKSEQAAKLGDRIFIPVLVIPLVTFAFAIAFWLLHLDMNRGALVGLGFGGVAAMAVGLILTRGPAGARTPPGTRPARPVLAMMDDGRRINDAMGAVNILPQLLASLGIIFTAAKIGDLIASGIHWIIPGNSLFLLVLANCVGMSLFTIVTGNSFAAFPVIATGVLVPLIIKPFGADPAMVAIITLTAGSSGTLMTPMAANFNIVPTALLDMRDQYGVIKFQLPFAATIWSIHVLLMWLMIRLF
jgi:uncharacterized membrane protein